MVHTIHWFTANDYVMFQEIWNEFRGVKKHSHFLMNYNLRKRSTNNKLFIHSVKIHKDFFKLIYQSYALWIIRKDESRGIKELLKNTWLKNNRDKKKLVARVYISLITKTNLKSMIFQYLSHLRYLMVGWRMMKKWHFGQCYHTQVYLNFWCCIPVN